VLGDFHSFLETLEKESYPAFIYMETELRGTKHPPKVLRIQISLLWNSDGHFTRQNFSTSVLLTFGHNSLLLEAVVTIVIFLATSLISAFSLPVTPTFSPLLVVRLPKVPWRVE
jgi:hypothetical protein